MHYFEHSTDETIERSFQFDAASCLDIYVSMAAAQVTADALDPSKSSNKTLKLENVCNHRCPFPVLMKLTNS